MRVTSIDFKSYGRLLFESEIRRRPRPHWSYIVPADTKNRIMYGHLLKHVRRNVCASYICMLATHTQTVFMCGHCGRNRHTRKKYALHVHWSADCLLYEVNSNVTAALGALAAEGETVYHCLINITTPRPNVPSQSLILTTFPRDCFVCRRECL